MDRKSIRRDFIRLCAWCDRVFHNEKWIEANLSHVDKKNATHGICEPCKEHVVKNKRKR